MCLRLLLTPDSGNRNKILRFLHDAREKWPTLMPSTSARRGGNGEKQARAPNKRTQCATSERLHSSLRGRSQDWPAPTTQSVADRSEAQQQHRPSRRFWNRCYCCVISADAETIRPYAYVGE